MPSARTMPMVIATMNSISDRPRILARRSMRWRKSWRNWYMVCLQYVDRNDAAVQIRRAVHALAASRAAWRDRRLVALPGHADPHRGAHTGRLLDATAGVDDAAHVAA